MNLQLDTVVWVLQDLWGFPKWQYWAVASAVPTAAANAAAPCPFGYQQTSPRLAKSSPVVKQMGKDRSVKSHQVTLTSCAQPCPIGPPAMAWPDRSPSLCDSHTSRTKIFSFLEKKAMEKLLIPQFFSQSTFPQALFPFQLSKLLPETAKCTSPL